MTGFPCEVIPFCRPSTPSSSPRLQGTRDQKQIAFGQASSRGTSGPAAAATAKRADIAREHEQAEDDEEQHERDTPRFADRVDRRLADLLIDAERQRVLIALKRI